MKSDLVDLSVIVVARTEKAVLVRDSEDAAGVWLPLSQCEVEGEVGGIGTVTCPAWLAAGRALI